MKLEAEYFTRLVNNQDHVFTTPIQPEDMESPAYRRAMAELKAQIRNGTMPDMASIAMAIPEHQAELFSANSMSKENFDHYEKLLVEAIQERRISQAVNKIGMKLGHGSNTHDIISEAINIFSECRVGNGAGRVQTFHDCLQRLKPIIQDRYENQGRLPGIHTGFNKLDDILGGFQPQVYFIGARPSQGKTALLLSMIRASMRAGKTAVMLSLESSQHAIIQRVLSAESNVSMTAIKTGRIHDSELTRLDGADNRMKTWKGYLEFNPRGHVDDIERSCHSFVKGHDVEIIFIDYLQRITWPAGRTKQDEVSKATRMITDLSRELDIPIICMAQTGRQADHEEPEISHFQHSSQIEQDADVAMIIQHRRSCGCNMEHSDPSECPEMKEASYLAVLKNRDGECGHIPVIFDREHVKFLTDGEK